MELAALLLGSLATLSPYWLNVTVSDAYLEEPGAAIWTVGAPGYGASLLHSSWASAESSSWQRLCPPECTTDSGERRVWRYSDAWIERVDCYDPRDGPTTGLLVLRIGISLPVNECDFTTKLTNGGAFIPYGGATETPCTIRFTFAAGSHANSDAVNLPEIVARGETKPLPATCLIGVYEAEVL